MFWQTLDFEILLIKEWKKIINCSDKKNRIIFITFTKIKHNKNIIHLCLTLDSRLALSQQLQLWASHQLVLTCCWAILKFRAQQPKSPRLSNPPSRPLYGWPQLWLSYKSSSSIVLPIADKKPEPFAARKGVIKLTFLLLVATEGWLWGFGFGRRELGWWNGKGEGKFVGMIFREICMFVGKQKNKKYIKSWRGGSREVFGVRI